MGGSHKVTTRCRRQRHATAGRSESLQRGDRSRSESVLCGVCPFRARLSHSSHSACSLMILATKGGPDALGERSCPLTLGFVLLCSGLPAALSAFPPACCCDVSLSVFVSGPAAPRPLVCFVLIFNASSVSAVA